MNILDIIGLFVSILGVDFFLGTFMWQIAKSCRSFRQVLKYFPHSFDVYAVVTFIIGQLE